MAKASYKPSSSNPNMMIVKTFALMFVVNSVVLYVANMFFPEFIVLGTATLSPYWAIFHSMGTLALVNTLALPFAHEIAKWKGRDLTTQEWMLKYFLLNALAFWVITRFSEQFGVGVSAWYVVVALAVVLDVVQGMVMMQMEKKK